MTTPTTSPSATPSPTLCSAAPIATPIAIPIAIPNANSLRCIVETAYPARAMSKRVFSLPLPNTVTRLGGLAGNSFRRDTDGR